MHYRTHNLLRCAFFLLIGLTLTMHADAQTLKRAGRDIQVIDGTWKFLTAPKNGMLTKGWELAAPPEAKETSVPALWDREAAPGYAGVAWYWREFTVASNWKGASQIVRLRFEAVAERAQVWLNGVRLGEHRTGATPFSFDITKALKFGETNTLAVRVEGEAKRGAGIWQGVLLMTHDEAYLDDAFPQGDPGGAVTVPIMLLNTSKGSGDATLDANLAASNKPERSLKKTNQILHITPDRNITTLLISLRRKDVTLWTLDKPFLYTLLLVFRQEKDILDTLGVTFGIRQFGYTGGALTLNGEPLTLTAIAPGATLPIVISSSDDTIRARELLRRIKEKGVNVVHLEAPPPALLQIADEEGLLVVVSARSGRPLPDMQDELRALVLRDRAHPSVLAWNLGETDAAFAQEIRRDDPTRFLLVGSPTHFQIWPPNQNRASDAALPAGLLPPH